VLGASRERWGSAWATRVESSALRPFGGDPNRVVLPRDRPFDGGRANRPRLVTDALPIRGRAEHVALIDGLVANVRRGQGSVLVIEGPPGIGKSRLVREVSAQAQRAGARALWGKAYEDQQTVPFGPLFDAILRSDPPICDVEVLRELSTRTGSRFWVVRDLQTAIASAAATTPLSISVDDVHWADAGTIVALQALVAGLAQSSVLWTFAMRSAGGRPEARDAMSAIAAARGRSAHFVRLGAVDGEAAAQIAGDLLGATVDESVLLLAGLAHGNPFLILETLRGLDEEDRIRVASGRAWATGRGLPQRLAATMQRRLDRVSPTARHTVQVASILPESFSATLLARALGQSAAQIVVGVEEAVRADLLTEEEGQFRSGTTCFVAQRNRRFRRPSAAPWRGKLRRFCSNWGRHLKRSPFSSPAAPRLVTSRPSRHCGELLRRCQTRIPPEPPT